MTTKKEPKPKVVVTSEATPEEQPLTNPDNTVDAGGEQESPEPEHPQEAPEVVTGGEPEDAPVTDEPPASTPAPVVPLAPTGDIADLVARKVLVEDNSALHPATKAVLAAVAPKDLAKALQDPTLATLNAALLDLQAKVDAPRVTKPARGASPIPVTAVPATAPTEKKEPIKGRTLGDLTPGDFSEFAKLL